MEDLEELTIKEKLILNALANGRGEHITSPMTLNEIAESFDPPMSRERIRQIEKQALHKCKIVFESHGITFDDLLPEGNDAIEEKILKRSR